jgi:hypothetical protein
LKESLLWIGALALALWAVLVIRSNPAILVLVLIVAAAILAERLRK